MSASIWEPGATVPVVDPDSTVKVQAFTASAAQTLFNLTLFTYNTGADALEVFKDGLKIPKADVTETSTSSFTLAACTGGEIIEAVGNTVVASASGSAAQALASANAAAASKVAADLEATAAAASAAAAAASALLAVLDWRGSWTTATNYFINDAVKQGGSSYLCVVAHTSGTFAADLAAVKWDTLAKAGVDGLGAGDMIAANNLSDVANVVTARSNLGLGSAALAAEATFATALNPVLTGVASFADGSAAAPSITNTGDSNTGIYFPAADTVAVGTNGAERMRIDASGRVGIGATPTTYPLEVAGTALVYSTATTGNIFIGSDGNVAVKRISGNTLTLRGGGGDLVTLDTTTGFTLNNGTCGLGYGTGAGGSVTQATSKGTAVTLNKPTGRITTHNSELVAGQRAGFTFWNSLIGANDMLLTSLYANGNYRTDVQIQAGSASIYITNVTTGSLSEAVAINFAIIKGSAT